MIDSLCVLVRKPQGEEVSLLGLRCALATLLAAIDTKLVLIGDGVYNLIKSTHINSEVLKTFIEEEGEVYCAKSSLEERGLPENLLFENVEIIEDEKIAEIVKSCKAVVVF